MGTPHTPTARGEELDTQYSYRSKSGGEHVIIGKAGAPHIISPRRGTAGETPPEAVHQGPVLLKLMVINAMGRRESVADDEQNVLWCGTDLVGAPVKM